MLDQVTPTTKRRGKPINHSAPFCVPCQRRMKSSGAKGSRWLCEQCKHSFYKHTLGELRSFGNTHHPYCVKCRGKMAQHGSDYKGIVIWRCTFCKVYANAARIQQHTPRLRPRVRTARKLPTLKLDHPQCIKCRWQMKRTGATAKRQRWECHLCGGSCRMVGAMREPKPRQIESGGDNLIGFIDSKLTNYSVEMREELRGEIAIALLSHAKIGGIRLSRETLTSATIKQIAKPIYKMQPNRFRDISLDHTYGEGGQRLEERLVG